MKLLPQINGIYKFLSPRAHTSIKRYPKYFLSTQVSTSPGRAPKAEMEWKSIQANILPDIMSSHEIKTAEDWKNVRDDLIKTGKFITPVTVDSIILSYCISTQNYELGYKYMEFLKNEKLKPSLAAIGKYFKLLYLSNCNGILTQAEEIQILTMYEKLRKTYRLLDSSTCENVIHALSITKSWKECLKLIDEIKITCNPTTSAFSVIAAAAFKNNENDLGWKSLDEVVDKGHIPNSVAYLSYLEKMEETLSENSIGNLEKLFEYFQLHDIKCDVEVAKKISDIFKKLKLRANTAVISNSGICTNCEKKLQKLELNQEEFNSLKTAIFKNVIVGKNVFYKTTPDELQNFQNFIANMKKYDVVIDGLNVAYSIGPRQSPHVLSSMVATVVKHFADQNKKILVLGRTHMKKWSKSNWMYVTRNADTFLTQTLSQDDPYLLYCALNSGLNTTIVSKDLMRGHLFKLKEPRLKLLFGQWLTLSQYQLQFVNNQRKVFFKYPPVYSRTAQKLENSWHIPYEELLSNGTVESKWLCLNT